MGIQNKDVFSALEQHINHECNVDCKTQKPVKSLTVKSMWL